MRDEIEPSPPIMPRKRKPSASEQDRAGNRDVGVGRSLYVKKARLSHDNGKQDGVAFGGSNAGAVPSSASAAGPSTSLFQPQQHQEASPLASPVVQIQVARKKPPRKKPVTLLVEPLRTPSPPRSAFKSPVRSRKANRFQISRPPAATQPASASAPVGRPPSSRQPDTRAVLPPPGVEPSRLPLPRSISATQPVTARVAALDINGPGTSSSSHAQNILSSIDEFQRRRRRSVLPSTSSSDDLPNDASALLREIEADQAASSANASASKPIPRTADSSDDGVVVRKGGEQGLPIKRKKKKRKLGFVQPSVPHSVGHARPTASQACRISSTAADPIVLSSDSDVPAVIKSFSTQRPRKHPLTVAGDIIDITDSDGPKPIQVPPAPSVSSGHAPSALPKPAVGWKEDPDGTIVLFDDDDDGLLIDANLASSICSQLQIGPSDENLAGENTGDVLDPLGASPPAMSRHSADAMIQDTYQSVPPDAMHEQSFGSPALLLSSNVASLEPVEEPIEEPIELPPDSIEASSVEPLGPPESDGPSLPFADAQPDSPSPAAASRDVLTPAIEENVNPGALVKNEPSDAIEENAQTVTSQASYGRPRVKKGSRSLYGGPNGFFRDVFKLHAKSRSTSHVHSRSSGSAERSLRSPMSLAEQDLSMPDTEASSPKFCGKKTSGNHDFEEQFPRNVDSSSVSLREESEFFSMDTTESAVMSQNDAGPVADATGDQSASIWEKSRKDVLYRDVPRSRRATAPSHSNYAGPQAEKSASSPVTVSRVGRLPKPMSPHEPTLHSSSLAQILNEVYEKAQKKVIDLTSDVDEEPALVSQPNALSVIKSEPSREDHRTTPLSATNAALDVHISPSYASAVISTFGAIGESGHRSSSEESESLASRASRKSYLFTNISASVKTSALRTPNPGLSRPRPDPRAATFGELPTSQAFHEHSPRRSWSQEEEEREIVSLLDIPSDGQTDLSSPPKRRVWGSHTSAYNATMLSRSHPSPRRSSSSSGDSAPPPKTPGQEEFSHSSPRIITLEEHGPQAARFGFVPLAVDPELELMVDDYTAMRREMDAYYPKSKDIPHDLQDRINALGMHHRRAGNMQALIFEAIITENTAEDEPHAPPIRIINDIDDESTPPFEFYYSNKRWHGEGVPKPDLENLQGCDCNGRCDRNSETCACMKRQRQFLEDTGITGFIYDERRRLRTHEYPIFECNSHCRCSDDCINRVVQRGREVAINIRKTPNKGWGVFAGDKKIPANTYIGVYAGECITDSEAEMRGSIYNKFGRTYLFDLDFWHLKGGDEEWSPKFTIDAYHAGNFTRYLNHSCDPNCSINPCYIDEGNLDKPLLTIFTLRDVAPGEELCFSYFGRPDGDEEEEEEPPAKYHDAVYIPCQCGARNCRQRMWT